MEIAIAAGEVSGDFLAAGMVREFLKINPGAHFFGIGGEKMRQAGVEILFPLDALSVMGYVDALKNLPQILKMRRALFQSVLKRRATAFVGVDAPDFNLGLEKKIKKQGILTAHFVSPSVWAWRAGRVKKIAQSVDAIWVLFPHEQAIYEKVHLSCQFVGHPLADNIPLKVDPLKSRQALGLHETAPIFAFLPGSRQSELRHHSTLFVQTAQRLAQQLPHAQFVVPLANPLCRSIFEEALAQNAGCAQLILFDAHVEPILSACDVALVASGTATLETALYKKPMVITYVLPRLSFWLAQKWVQSAWVGLPNILLKENVVPELLQDDATAPKLSAALLDLFFNTAKRRKIEETFLNLHLRLKQNAAFNAALALQKLVDTKNTPVL